MELLTAVTVLSKLLQAALSTRDAWVNEGFDTKELAALRAVTDLLGALSGSAAERSPELDTLHLGVVTRCFGHAFARHWAFNESLAPSASWFRRFMDKDVRKRAKEIDLRINLATDWLRRFAKPGDLPSVKEWNQVELLAGSPLAMPYYQALWNAFTNPKLDDEDGGTAPLLDLGETGRLEFERHFLLAYHQALSSAVGQPLQAYLQRLSGDYRARLLRELFLKDMAGWGRRHIFGNAERHEWRAEDPIPFMPLSEVYVEPNAQREGSGPDALSPVTQLFERLLSEPKPSVLVVKADFGMGKSLTARTLAQRWAQRFLVGRAPSPEQFLPIYVRCADDFPDEAFDLEQTVRRAWKRQASALGLELKTSDESLGLPDKGQRTLFLIDGLDEVVLGDRRLESFFKRIKEEATDRHRFIIFSRPGALPAGQELREVVVLDILPWSEEQVGKWLERWRGLHEGMGPTYEQLQARQLTELAGTPILLFMLAQTWKHLSAETGTGLSALYETFFWQIAKGKHDAACERHPNISHASEELREHLVQEELLARETGAPDAMLWLMGRVAWEATKLTQRQMLPDGKEEFLTRRDIENLLVEELGIQRNASDTIDAIQVGLLLTLQAHLRSGSASQWLFGHKSFREYLVARYWADRLKAIAGARSRDWEELEKPMLGGRLLSREDRTFEFLMEMLNGEPLPSHPHAPFGLRNEERDALLDWAQSRFESEDQEFLPRSPERFRDDRRPWLREAALAIGSSLRGSQGLRVRDNLTVRTMLSWFWLMRIGPIIMAPRARWADSVISELSLRGANFSKADLRRVSFTNSDLVGRRYGKTAPCDFSEAVLDNASLAGANLEAALFVNASLGMTDLTGANLKYADFSGANLEEVTLFDADLVGADLTGANLTGGGLYYADLRLATLTGATLDGCTLHGADLSDAFLDKANLAGARYDRETRWPEGLDPKAAGAILEE